jgi:hypothetical protein
MIITRNMFMVSIMRPETNAKLATEEQEKVFSRVLAYQVLPVCKLTDLYTGMYLVPTESTGILALCFQNECEAPLEWPSSREDPLVRHKVSLQKIRPKPEFF